MNALQREAGKDGSSRAWCMHCGQPVLLKEGRSLCCDKHLEHVMNRIMSRRTAALWKAAAVNVALLIAITCIGSGLWYAANY